MYQEQIDRLLAAQTAENNYLAIQLMMNVLHYSFEQAYSFLKPHNKNDELVTLAIAELEIRYKVDLQRIIYAPSSYADIERSVYYKKELVPNSNKRLFADDDSILSLGEFGTVEDLAEIKNDIVELAVLVKDLLVF